MSQLLRHLSVAIALVAVTGSRVPAGTLQSERTEPEAKAVLLQKVLAFVTWPKGEKPGPRPLKIAFIGQTPVARELTRLVNDRAAGNAPLEVHYEALDSNLDGYQVVFLSHSNARHAQALVDKTSSKPVLTVCDSTGGCDKGIILTLLVAENRIRFEVNLKQARRAGLSFQSQVLQYAGRVCDGGAP